MVEYDQKVFQDFTESLYKQAKQTTPLYFFIGVFLGVITSAVVSSIMVGDFDFLILAIGVLIGGIMGYGSGKYKSLEMRLEAQKLLCQSKIEENTRK
jgi:hypothetical protein